MLPLNLYKKASRDHQLAATKSRITAFGGTTLPVVGTALLRVHSAN